MTSEVVIDVQEKEISIALLEDQKLVEYQNEPRSASFSVGNIYIAKVKKLMPGLNACFVDVGYERDAFLHYLDLGGQFSSFEKYLKQVQSDRKKLYPFSKAYQLPELKKDGSVQNTLSVGQEVLVQIVKEPISTKGPRITTEISFAGRYLVLVPFGDKVSVSQKIKSSEERKRLRTAVQSIRPRNFGIIIRTVAENKSVEELSADLDMLRYRWDTTVENLFASKAPLRLAQEENRVASLLRDFLNDSFHAIYVDTPEMFTEVKNYLHVHAPEQEAIVNLYNEKRPIFDYFNVAKQIKGSFGKVVTVKNGVYLIIEHTEAMHVIDVGGIITIDFVDLHDPANKNTLNKAMAEFMRNDKAKHTILPLNKFGLIQITRQRVRQATIIENTEVCPTCKGTGKIKPPIVIEDEIANALDFLFDKQHEPKITIVTHPFVYAYLTKGFPSIRLKWCFKYKKNIRITPNQSSRLTEVHYMNNHNEDIILWNEPARE